MATDEHTMQTEPHTMPKGICKTIFKVYPMDTRMLPEGYTMATRRRVFTSDAPDLVYEGVTWLPDGIKYFKKRRENHLLINIRDIHITLKTCRPNQAEAGGKGVGHLRRRRRKQRSMRNLSCHQQILCPPEQKMLPNLQRRYM